MPNISVPQLNYKRGMQYGPSTNGSDVILSGASKVTVECGDLYEDSVIRIFQTATSASTPGPIFEVKYDNGGSVRLNGSNGQFVVSYHGGHQNFTITPSAAPDAGTFTITFNGQTTAAINFDASAADIQLAVEALSNVGTGNATVTGTMATAVVVKFRAALMRLDAPNITSTSLLTNTGAPVTLAITDTTTKATNAITFDWLVTRF